MKVKSLHYLTNILFNQSAFAFTRFSSFVCVDYITQCRYISLNQLISTGKHSEALLAVLQNAPLGCKNQQIKVRISSWYLVSCQLVHVWASFSFQDNALNITLRVLLSIKSSQMEPIVDALEERDLLDVLMKYIYRGFEIPSEGSSGHLLQWHEKAFAKGGVGCIVRVLSDTNRA